MKNEFNWRNNLEHELIYFMIDKIVKFIGLTYDLIEKIKSVNFKIETVNYNIVALENQKMLISKSNELSYIAMFRDFNKEERNIIDLAYKYLELNKYIFFTYDKANTVDKISMYYI